MVFGHMNPKNIKPKHIYQYIDARGQTSKIRANREKSLLSNVFTYLIRWGIVEVNPCRSVQAFSEKPRTRYVADWEYEAVFNLAPPIIQAAMEIAVITSMRQGDILNIKLSDLTDAGIMLIQGKTGKKQIFEWTDGLQRAVALAKSHSRKASSAVWLISNEQGQQYTSSGFKSNWQRLMEKAIKTGVVQERFTFHDLRSKVGSDHSHGDRLLGHQDPKTTRKHYERKPIIVKPIR